MKGHFIIKEPIFLISCSSSSLDVIIPKLKLKIIKDIIDVKKWKRTALYNFKPIPISKIQNWEEAIYKMTFKSAKTFGLEKRGLIKKDYFADLVIFDPEVVIDKATYEKPLLPALGIDTVINNGQIVWQSMKSLNIYSGKFLEGKSFN